uniref:Uncharacterized protein n=1 Tax=Arundo donax TaxID=35708 RepID=A0A0A9E3E1_ARUDO
MSNWLVLFMEQTHKLTNGDEREREREEGGWMRKTALAQPDEEEQELGCSYQALQR